MRAFTGIFDATWTRQSPYIVGACPELPAARDLLYSGKNGRVVSILECGREFISVTSTCVDRVIRGAHQQSRSYFREGVQVNCQELFSCAAEVAVGAITSVIAVK